MIKHIFFELNLNKKVFCDKKKLDVLSISWWHKHQNVVWLLPYLKDPVVAILGERHPSGWWQHFRNKAGVWS